LNILVIRVRISSSGVNNDSVAIIGLQFSQSKRRNTSPASQRRGYVYNFPTHASIMAKLNGVFFNLSRIREEGGLQLENSFGLPWRTYPGLCLR